MMNRVLSGIIIVMCMATLIGCNDMKFNNSANKNDLLTEKYSIVQIQELKNTAESEHITFSKFKRDFDVQVCAQNSSRVLCCAIVGRWQKCFCFFQ